MAYLNVRVTPGARQDAVAGWQGTALKVKVRAAPEKGKANDAVCALIARTLGVPPGAVAIVRTLTPAITHPCWPPAAATQGEPTAYKERQPQS